MTQAGCRVLVGELFKRLQQAWSGQNIMEAADRLFRVIMREDLQPLQQAFLIKAGLGPQAAKCSWKAAGEPAAYMRF